MVQASYCLAASCSCCQNKQLKDPSVLLDMTVTWCCFIMLQRSAWKESLNKIPSFSERDAIFSFSISLDAHRDFTCVMVGTHEYRYMTHNNYIILYILVQMHLPLWCISWPFEPFQGWTGTANLCGCLCW